MTWWTAMLAAWGGNALLMGGLWVIATRRRNAGVVDVAWSFATGVTGAFLALAVGGIDRPRAWLVAAFAAAWGIRLGLHLARRVAGEAEDGRYADLRERWGTRFDRNMAIFFQVQATWAVLFAVPMMAAAMRPGDGLDWMDGLAAAIWAISVGGEAIADRQLARWKQARSEDEQVCRRGLWSWSRHPNYFFEWVHWFAYVAAGVAGPIGWLTLAGPVIMYVFLNHVTGIPIAEKRSVERRGDAYRRYQREVSAFFPRPPRSGSDDPTDAPRSPEATAS